MESDEGDLVFYGTPIEREEDITSRNKKAVTEASGQLRTLPSWKQEVTDEEGRGRFHGTLTAGFSAGYHNRVGSQEGWTPSSFTSSRKNRAEIKQQDIYNFLDEDEKADLESRSLGTSMQFDTFGFTAVELARKQAEKEQQQRPSAIPGPVPDEIVAPIMESVDSIRAGKVEESVPTGRDSLSFAESGRGDKATEATDKEIEVDVKVENVERPVDLYKAIFSDDSDDEGKSSSSSQVDDPEKKIEVANTTLSRLIAGDFLESLGKELGLEVPPDLLCSEGNVSAESAQKETINVNGEKERLQVGNKSSTHNALGGNSTSHLSQEVQPYHLEANQEGRSHAHDTTDGEVYRSSSQINVKSNGDNDSSKIDETGVIKSDASENKLVKVPQEDRKSKTSKSGHRHWTSSSPEDESSRKSRRHRRSSSNSDSDTSSSSDDHEDRHRSRSKKKMKREKSSTRSHSEHHKHKRKDSSSSSRHGSQKERREVKKERHKHKDRR